MGNVFAQLTGENCGSVSTIVRNSIDGIIRNSKSNSGVIISVTSVHLNYSVQFPFPIVFATYAWI